MAKFTGNGIVWDKEKNKMLCKFVCGIYETTDERTKKILNELKYPCDSSDEIVIIEDEETEEPSEETLEDLKAICKEKGYKGYGNIHDIEKMKAFIEKREGD